MILISFEELSLEILPLDLLEHTFCEKPSRQTWLMLHLLSSLDEGEGEDVPVARVSAEHQRCRLAELQLQLVVLLHIDFYCLRAKRDQCYCNILEFLVDTKGSLNNRSVFILTAAARKVNL